MSARDLGAAVSAAIADGDIVGGRVVVAWSGGLDSTVLLHLLVHDARVKRRLGGARVVAAHLDHAMREDSAEDARAVEKTAQAWGVEFVSERLSRAPRSEEEARDARYAFLDRVAVAVGASRVWTAHHADDQVETVLFRIARGTGVSGLTGIPARSPTRVRPLLLADPPVRRADLRAWARARDLPVRVDASNAMPGATRNRLRHELLPLLDEIVPGAGEAVLRLARNAARHDEALDALSGFALDRGGLDAEVWTEAPEALRRALIRFAAGQRGVALDEAATEAALALAPDAQSGRGVDLPGGLRFERVFDRWQMRSVARPSPGGEAASLTIEVAGAGQGDLGLPDRRFRVTWSVGSGVPGSLAVDIDEDALPLTLRAWRPGDRIRLGFGTTPLVKAWAEARVPAHQRPGRWVLADRRGRIVAAEGLGPAEEPSTIGDPRSPRLTVHLTLDRTE